MAVGIKEIDQAKKAIKDFGEDLNTQVTSKVNEFPSDVEAAFFGRDQVEAINGYIKAVNKAVGKLFEDMEYWTDALQKVYDEVYKAESANIASQVNDAASNINIAK